MELKQGHFIAIALLAEAFLMYASVLVKLTDVPPITVGFFRIFLALPVFFLMASWGRGDKKGFFRYPLRDLGLMFCAGVFFAGDLVFFNLALRNTSVANVNLIGSLPCFILVPLGVLFFNEKLRRGFLIGGAVTLLGVFVLIKGRGEESVASGYGDFQAFLSVVCYGIFLALIYALRRRYAAKEIMLFSCISSSAVLFGLASLLEGFEMPSSSHDWLIIVGIAFFGQVVGQGLFSFVMGKLSTQTSSLLLLFSPAVAALMGFFILGEKLGIYEILAIGIIVAGIYLAKRESV